MMHKNNEKIALDRVKMLGVPLADVFSTMKAYTGSVYVNDFNMFNRIYKVYIQAEAPYRGTFCQYRLYPCFCKTL